MERRTAFWLCVLLLRLEFWCPITEVAANSVEISAAPMPVDGADGSHTYRASQTIVDCNVMNPAPANGPWDPSPEETAEFCSRFTDCGGFVYTTAQASVAQGNANRNMATYCKPQSFVDGVPSTSSGIGFVRYIYKSCDMQVKVPMSTVHNYGSIKWKRAICVSVSRGLTADRETSPKLAPARQRERPSKTVFLDGAEYTVGKDVFRNEAEAKYRSADGSAHWMQTDGGITYYMPSDTHHKRGQPLLLNGFYPLYERQSAAEWASSVGGGNGLAIEIGPSTAYGLPAKWERPPGGQVYYMPADGPPRYFGTYVQPIALDGYFPLYSSKTDAEQMSTDGLANPYGPGSAEGHPVWWTSGQRKVYWMPNAGFTKYFGNYPPEKKGAYETVMRSTVRQDKSRAWPPTFAL